MISSISIDYLHTIKRFQELLSNSNSFICTQLTDYKYCSVTLTIQFNIIWNFNRYYHFNIDWTQTGSTTPG